MAPKRIVHVMPKQWAYPFVAAWRVFERTLNPAFVFLIKCTSCGKIGKSTFVMSNKNPKAVLGLECSECLQTVKFETIIDPDAEDFPSRLLTKPNSVLSSDGKPKKGDELDSEGYLELMFDHDE